jgi:hypothetical protein
MTMSDTAGVEPGPDTEPILPQASVEDVFRAAEELREAEFPDVPADLLEAVLSAERDNLDNASVATRAVARAVEDYLSREGR